MPTQMNTYVAEIVLANKVISTFKHKYVISIARRRVVVPAPTFAVGRIGQ